MKLNVLELLVKEGQPEMVRFFYFDKDTQHYGDVKVDTLVGVCGEGVLQELKALPQTECRLSRGVLKTENQISSGVRVKDYSAQTQIVKVVAQAIESGLTSKLSAKYPQVYQEFHKVGTVKHILLNQFNGNPSSIIFTYQMEHKKLHFTVPFSYFKELKILNESTQSLFNSKKLKSIIPGESKQERLFGFEMSVYRPEEYMYGKNNTKTLAVMGMLTSRYMRKYVRDNLVTI